MTAPSPPDGPPAEDLADAFLAVAHGLKRTINARFQHTDLSIARLAVLFHLTDRDSIRLGELSERLNVAPRTVTSTIEAMERDGLVKRKPDPSDRRAVVVSITDEGRRSFTSGRRLHARTVADVFEALDASQRATLATILEQLQSTTAKVNCDAT